MKLAIFTPPIVWNCGKTLKGYLRYDSQIIMKEAVISRLMSKTQEKISPKELSSFKLTTEEIIYVSGIISIIDYQIMKVNEKHKKCL